MISNSGRLISLAASAAAVVATSACGHGPGSVAAEGGREVTSGTSAPAHHRAPAARQRGRDVAGDDPRLAVPYGDDDEQVLDLYFPRGDSDGGKSGARPLLVYVHGGGWSSGSPDLLDWELEGMQEAMPRAVVASVGYRLAPGSTALAQTRDVRRALHWLTGHARRWGVSTSKVVIVGWSSGGQVAGVAGLRTNTPVAGLLTFNAPLDLRDYGAKVESSANTADSAGAHGVIGAVQSSLRCGSDAECHDAAAKASPVTYVRTEQPPSLIVRGREDTLIPIDSMRSYVDAARAAGAKARFLQQDGVGHEVSWSRPVVRWLRRTVS